ncbi:MAG: hypothetical protein C5B54_04855, partial [Acidobacteria bacterium]
MATLVAETTSSQAVQSCIVTSPFPIEDPNSVWWIQSGHLDVFLANLIDGRPEGARFPVVRRESGEAVFGVGSHLENQVLMAVPSPAAKIRRLCLSELREWALAREEDLAARLLENWIDRLTCAVSDDTHLGQFLYLEAGQKVEVPIPTRALLPKQGLVWVNHTQGASIFRNAFHLLGDPRLPYIAGAGYFPVTRHAWLQSNPGSEVCAIAADDVWQEDPQLSGLQKFHQFAMTFLAMKHEKAEEKEKEAMRARAAADASMSQTALLRLTAPIRKLSVFKSGEDRCQNPTFLASEAVGRCLHLEIKPHPDMLQGRRIADPVEAIARASGIRTRTVVLRGPWWKEDIGPLLGFLEDGKKPVAILPRTGRGYQLYNPETKTTVPVTAAVAATLNPFGQVFYRPFPARKIGIFELIKFVWPICWQEFLLIVLTGIAAGLLGSVTPAATGIIFDSLIPGAERGQLGQMLAILLIVAFTTTMFTFVRNFVVLRIEGKLDAFVQAAVWDRLLSLPVSFFRNYSSGDLAQRSLGIAAIRRTLTGSTLSAIFSGVFSIFSFLLLFYYSWILALVASGLVILAFLVTTSCGIVQVRLQRRIAHINGAISSMVLQFINGIAKFRVSGTEARAFAVWAREFSGKKVIATRSRH